MQIKIKNLILAIFVSLFLANISSAQGFAPLGAKWYFPVHHCCSGSVHLMTYEVIGDTVINNKACKILYKDRGTINGGIGNYYFHQSSDTIYQYDELNDKYDMIIDFGAMPGDTFQIEKNAGNGYLESTHCIVDSISYIIISANDSLRVQHVTQVEINELGSGQDTFTCSKKIIEKIGFNDALMPLVLFSLADNFREGEVRCYEDTEIELFNLSDVDCLYTPTEEVEGQAPVFIYPNPVYETLFLELPTIAFDWMCTIYDIYGKELQLEKNILAQGVNVVEIDVSNWSPSIYFIILRNEANQVYYSGKFLRK